MSLTMTRPAILNAEEAVDLILEGTAPVDLQVEGDLEIAGAMDRLPDGLAVRRLVLTGCPNLEALPERLRVRHLEIRDCPKLRTLPAGLSCYEFVAHASALLSLPGNLRVEFRLDLRDSKSLVSLGANLKAGTLILRGCTALEQLAEGLDVCFLDLQGCRLLKDWPRKMTMRCGHLNLADCTGLTCLPSGIKEVAQLDLRGCSGITSLHPGLVVCSWLDLAGSGITKLPRSLHDVRLRWRGVPVTERVALRPETISVDEILNEGNSEVRRVMLERVGFERFLEQAKAEVLDSDRDAGGERRLLRVPLPSDEPLVCLSVSCPSTARQYVLRVPPTLRTCHQAAAWMAGFKNANDYKPVIET